MIHFPPYIAYPQLENENILLREITIEDIEFIVSISTYDQILAKNKTQAWEMTQKIKENYNDGNSFHWGIIEKSTNQIIGTCGFYRGFDDERGELGCILLPEFRRKGFMKQALQLAIEFGFKNINLNEIFAITSKNNENAKTLLESLNFKLAKENDEEDIIYSYKKSDY